MPESANNPILNYVNTKGKTSKPRILPVSFVLLANTACFLLFAMHFGIFLNSRIPLCDWHSTAAKAEFDVRSYMK